MPAHRSSTARLLSHLAVALVTVLAMTSTAGAPASAATAARQTSLTMAAATRPTVQSGSRGTDVRYLQQQLTALGYDVGGVDGIFGTNTLHAVYAFQKVQRIAVDGIIGPVDLGPAGQSVPAGPPLHAQRRRGRGESHPPGGLPDPRGFRDRHPGRVAGQLTIGERLHVYR